MGTLSTYWRKRDFTQTKEPRGKAGKSKSTKLAFIVQMHDATRLHYDLRLEIGGVMASWAVTRGPSLNPDDKRLAVRTEDHPMDYNTFEGVIPKGSYGAGEVILWDRGTWIPEGDVKKGLAKGHLRFELKGERLRGAWDLVLMRGRASEKRENWLLIKADDEHAGKNKKLPADISIVSGRSFADLRAGSSDKKTAPKPKAGKLELLKPNPKKKDAEKASSRNWRAAMPREASTKFSGPLDSYLKPCLALYQETAPLGEQWLHEVKFDGYRSFAILHNGKVSFITRNGLDWTSRYGAALQKSIQKLKAKSLILDGEVIVETESGASSFSALQDALSNKKTDELLFYAFDLLYLDGKDMRKLPLEQRKDNLEHLLKKARDPLRYSPHFETDGSIVLQQSCRLGLEGVISKKRSAPYIAGRKGDWIKTKCRQRQEFVIVGYSPSTAAGRQIGSLLLGYNENGKLKYAGRAGSGFTAKSGSDAFKLLKKITTKDATVAGHKKERLEQWVEPRLLVDIEFAGWTGTGMVRQGVIKGIREDKAPREVVRESKTPARKVPAKKSASAYHLSHPDRLLWPEAGVSKQGLLDYYEAVWPLMKSFVTDRPLSLVRCPDGNDKACFFQKHLGQGMTKGMRNKADPKDKKPLVLVDSFEGLATLVQFGTLEIHGWLSSAAHIEKADMLIFDLDPDAGRTWEDVKTGALLVKSILERHKLKPFVKLSGGKGLHIVAPIKPEHSWETIKDFCHGIATQMRKEQPDVYIDTASKAKRRGRIFVDYLRNGRGATAVLPYSTRRHKHATVALPLEWSELSAIKTPIPFTIDNALARVQSIKDPWKNFFANAKSLKL